MGGSVSGSFFEEAYDSCFRLSACGTTLLNTSFAHMPGGVHVVCEERRGREGGDAGGTRWRLPLHASAFLSPPPSVDESWLEGSKGIANITVANNSFTAIGAPPYAATMKQVRSL